MTREKLNPNKKSIDEAIDRTELFHGFILNYIIHEPVYKLDKDFAVLIDNALEGLEKGKEVLLEKYIKGNGNKRKQ